MANAANSIKLSFNEMPWGPLPAVTDAILAFVNGPSSVNRYPDMRAAELRAAIAAHHAVPVEYVAVGTGSGGLLNQLTFATTGPGDEVLMPWPTFGQYAGFAGWTGATATKVPLVGTTPSGAALAAAMTPRTRMLVIATPNNPTGTVLHRDGLRAVLERASRDCVVVLDQAYQDFAAAPHAPDAADLVGSYPNVVVLRTFSKAHGLAGLRIGYVLAQPETVAAVERLAVPFNVDGIAQAAAVASLRAFDQVQERVAIIVAERERVIAELRRRGFGQANSQANFVWLPAGSAANELAVTLERSGVSTRVVADEGVRVTVGTPAENDRFLEVFGTGELVAGLAECWRLPTGPDAARVHELVERLVEPAAAERIDLAAASALLSRCEVAIWGSSTVPGFVDVREVLHVIADLVADASAEALPRLEPLIGDL
jgi:histidinol-phosphate aminotransferase